MFVVLLGVVVFTPTFPALTSTNKSSPTVKSPITVEEARAMVPLANMASPIPLDRPVVNTKLLPS